MRTEVTGTLGGEGVLNMKRVLACAIVLIAAGLCRAQEAGEKVLPSRRCGEQFVVDAMINGQGPFALLLDTGCSTLVLDPDAAKKLGGAGKCDGDAVSSNGTKVEVGGVVKIESLRVGDVELEAKAAPLISLARVRYA